MANHQDLLSNLLAVIHADGGHYEAEHGTVKAVTDAIEKVFQMKAHLTKRAADECPTCAGLGFVNDKRGRRGVDCSDCNGSGIRR